MSGLVGVEEQTPKEQTEQEKFLQAREDKHRELHEKGQKAHEDGCLGRLSHHVDMWYMGLDFASKNAISLVLSVILLLAATALGGLVFAGLEADTGIEINAEYVQAMQTLQTQLRNATGNDASYYNNLIGIVGAKPPAQVPLDTWGLGSYKSFLFAFTIITTIGYGEIAPVTVGGRLWLCAYAVLCIPAAGVALTKIASMFMDTMEWVLMGMLPRVRLVFDMHDKEGTNKLSFEQAKTAIETVHEDDVDEEEFRAAFEEASTLMGDPALNYWEFVRLYLLLDTEEMQRKRRYYRLYVSMIFVAIWLVVGMLAFNDLEQWGYVPSFYFSFVTLSTVGLGDFFPTTSPGTDFHFFYCVFGLGLVAVFLGCVSDVVVDAAEQNDDGAYQKEWEDKNAAMLKSVEQVDEGQKELQDMIDNGGERMKGPRRSLLGMQTMSQGTGHSMMSTKMVFDETQKMTPDQRDRLLAMLIEKYKKVPKFVVDKVIACGQSPRMELPVPPPGAFTRAYPTARFDGPGEGGEDAVPEFHPTYCQIYEDAPVLLSGVPRPGAPRPPIAANEYRIDSSEDAYNRGLVLRGAGHGPFAPEAAPARPAPRGQPQNGNSDGDAAAAAAMTMLHAHNQIPVSRAGVEPTGTGRAPREGVRPGERADRDRL